MSDWTCDQVEGWIDLYAAGEADGATRAAVGRHLKACPACAESHRQAQQVVGLLDQRFQESERLERLWSRLEAEPKRARRPVRMVLWRASALAASALVALGLSGWLGPGEPGAPAGLQVAAVVNPPAARFAPHTAEMIPGHDFALKAADAAAPGMREAEPVYALDLWGKTPAEFRRDVQAAARTGLPPSPPAVDLDLTVSNPGREALPLHFGEKGTELILDLQGPGVLDVPAPNTPAPLAGVGAVRLGPGDTFPLPIRELAYGSPGAVRYLYWTEPGEYTLTVTLRVRVGADPLAGARDVRATAGPFRVRVAPER